MLLNFKIGGLFALRLALGLAGLAVIITGVRAGLSHDIRTFLACGLVAGLLSGAYTAADHYHSQMKFHWAVDLDPHAILQRVDETGGSYCLLLRSFAHDATVAVPNEFNPYRHLPVGFGMPFIDVQEWLIRSLGSKWRFFSWGGKIGAVRPVRVVTSEEWYPGVQEAIRRATVVFIIPGVSESLQREIEFALAERPHRLVFVFPPRPMNAPLYYLLRKNPLLQAMANDMPDDGALILPHRAFLPSDAPSLEFARYPISATQLRSVAFARSRADG